jgi:hypothetical protein
LIDCNSGDDKIDPIKAILSRWDRTTKTEEKLYTMKEKEQRMQKSAQFGQSGRMDRLEGKGISKDHVEDDEDLQELLDELRLSGPNVNFKRVNERRSKRFTSAFEEEIAERNEHLRQRMEQVQLMIVRFIE